MMSLQLCAFDALGSNAFSLFFYLVLPSQLIVVC